MVHILLVSLQYYSFPAPWSKTQEYLHQCDAPFPFSLFLTQPLLQKGNEVGQPPSRGKVNQASAFFSNEIFLLWFSYGPLMEKGSLLEAVIAKTFRQYHIFGKVISCTSKFAAAISKQTAEAARKVWNADEFHRHTQLTIHSNLKAINNQEVVPWIFKSIRVKWIQFLFFLWTFGELIDKTD